MSETQKKRCTGCNKVKPFDEFYRCGRANARSSRCIECEKAKRRKRKSKATQSSKLNEPAMKRAFRHAPWPEWIAARREPAWPKKCSVRTNLIATEEDDHDFPEVMPDITEQPRMAA